MLRPKKEKKLFKPEDVIASKMVPKVCSHIILFVAKRISAMAKYSIFFYAVKSVRTKQSLCRILPFILYPRIKSCYRVEVTE